MSECEEEPGQLSPMTQFDIEDHENSDQLIEAMRTSDNTFSGIAKLLIPYYKDINEYDEKAIEKFISDKSILEELKLLLNGQKLKTVTIQHTRLCMVHNFYFKSVDLG